LGCYAGIEVKDNLLPHAFLSKGMMALQDFAAPFFHFTNGEYRMGFDAAEASPKEDIAIQTKVNGRLFGKEVKAVAGRLVIGSRGMAQVAMNGVNFKLTAVCAPLS
jgi:hypothetical protein